MKIGVINRIGPLTDVYADEDTKEAVAKANIPHNTPVFAVDPANEIYRVVRNGDDYDLVPVPQDRTLHRRVEIAEDAAHERLEALEHLQVEYGKLQDEHVELLSERKASGTTQVREEIAELQGKIVNTAIHAIAAIALTAIVTLGVVVSR